MNIALNDPTRSGSPLPADAGEPIQLSRNEIESLSTKAARGAGMSWGLAEEAGFAAGWLNLHGLDGVFLLAGHLTQSQAKAWKDIRPVVESSGWHATNVGEPLCPIAVGATLSDYVSTDPSLLDGKGLPIDAVSFPALLLPFIALVAQALDATIRMQVGVSHAYVSTRGALSGDTSSLMDVSSATLCVVTVRSSVESCIGMKARQANQALAVRSHTSAVDSAALAILYELSMLTTVPSSSASRRNAGATGSDND